MKLTVVVALVFTAAVCARTTDPRPIPSPEDPTIGPWQEGMRYTYQVKVKNLAYYEEGPSKGSFIRGQFIVRVQDNGKLLAKFENAEHAKYKQDEANQDSLPESLVYHKMELSKPFEIIVAGGRVLLLNLPQSISVVSENLLKGLVSALQLDLSPHRKEQESHDHYDKETHQGQYRKMETDVTGDCETLYNISPYYDQNKPDESFYEVTKIRNYGNCNHRVAYHFGVPENSKWSGTAHKETEKQLMNRATKSHMIVDKQGFIYETDTINTVDVSPLMYGKQKAHVYSKVHMDLVSMEKDNKPQWEVTENKRQVKNLLYSMTEKSAEIDYSSSSSESKEESRSSEWLNKQKVNEKRNIIFTKKVGAQGVIINKEVIDDHNRRWDNDDVSSSSSSSSDSSSGYVNSDMPDDNKPVYAAIYLTPSQDEDSKNYPMAVQKLVQEISQQLHNPNTMPKADTLSKFNILVRIIASMGTEQLRTSSWAMEVAKGSKDRVKQDMWMVYRDALTQAGTIPAFNQLKTWITAKKLEGEEAAQVLSSLATALRYPTRDLMRQFMELAKSPVVVDQRYLNTTALISAARFINMGQVDHTTAANYYPTHMYGRLVKINEKYVKEEVLPELQRMLEDALTRKDNHKALVYIKVLGTLGHRDILEIFAPYFEGKVEASNYLRRAMVENLDVLANRKDHYVRTALFSILHNTYEPYHVRAAAIYNIFKGDPTTQMMQSMAFMTREDPSRQIRALLKSMIRTVAASKDPERVKQSKTALSVLHIVTDEDFEHYYSEELSTDLYDAEETMEFFSELTRIASKDSMMLNKYWNLRWAPNRRNKGQNRKTMNSFETSLSNPSRFLEYLQKIYQMLLGKNDKNSKYNSDYEYSANKVADILNISPEQSRSNEGYLNLNIMNQQRFYPVTEEDLDRFYQNIERTMGSLSNGAEYHYTKFINQAQVTIMFPLASGMPYIFKYKEPTLVHVEGKVKGVFEPKERQFNFDNDLQFTYARNLDGKAGFLDTFTNEYASAGVVSKVQVYVPLKTNMNIKPRHLEIQASSQKPDQDVNIIHYSVWPYVANQNRYSYVPVSLDPESRIIDRRTTPSSVDTKFGDLAGLSFQLQGYSYSKDVKNMYSLLQEANWNKILTAFYQTDVALTHYNLKYKGKQSLNKEMKFTAVYDEIFEERKPSKPLTPPEDKEDIVANNKNRRDEMLAQVSSGIKDVRARVVDIGVGFEGNNRMEYALTLAMSDSDVDTKIQYAFFGSRINEKLGNKQVNAAGTVSKPKTYSMNLKEALNHQLKTTFKVDAKFDKMSTINIEGDLQRLNKENQLSELPQFKECENQMENKNFYQPACYKALLVAHTPDNIKISISYKNISPEIKNLTYRAYRQVQHKGYNYLSEDIQKFIPDDKIEFNADLSYGDRSFNALVKSRLGQSIFQNVPVHEPSMAVSALYSPLKAMERLSNAYTNDLYLPHCTYDTSKISTFSGKSYKFTPSNNWQVLIMHQRDPEWANDDQSTVMARRTAENPLEVYISYEKDSKNNFEMRIKQDSKGWRDSVKVSTQLKEKSSKDQTMYFDEENKPVIRYYPMEDGVIMIKIRNLMKAMYDGERIVIFSNNYRNKTQGLCGMMNGEPNDDNRTPVGKLSQEMYAKYYTLNDRSEVKNLQRPEGYQKQVYTSILRSDTDFRMYNQEKSEKNWLDNSFRVRSYKDQSGPCRVHEQVQYYESKGQICITDSPLPSCTAQCRGDTFNTKSANVVCRSQFDDEFTQYKEQIRNGQDPKVNGVPKPKEFKVPTYCVA